MRLRCKHKPEQNKYERNAMTKLKVLSKNARQKKFCNLFSQVIADAYLQTCMQGRSPGSDNVFLSLSDLKQQETIHTIARIPNTDERPWKRIATLQAALLSNKSMYAHPGECEIHVVYLFSSWRYVPLNFPRIKNHRRRNQYTSERISLCCPVYS